MDIERALLLINREAGDGCSQELAQTLGRAFESRLKGLIRTQYAVVDGHAELGAEVRAFLKDSAAPAAIIAGGGGGSLRALIEAVCSVVPQQGLPGPNELRIAALRMGSGNLLARQFGVCAEPLQALQDIVDNLLADRIAPCCVMRCEARTNAGEARIHHAATMVGLGQFGRVPGDVARWRRRGGCVRRALGALLGTEGRNQLEYTLLFARRALRSVLRPRALDSVEVRIGDRTLAIELLAGAVMSFPVPGIPLGTAVRVEQPAVELVLLPRLGPGALFRALLGRASLRRQALRFRLNAGEGLQLRLRNRRFAQFFLDEDPTLLDRVLQVRVAGCLAMVPGAGYRSADA